MGTKDGKKALKLAPGSRWQDCGTVVDSGGNSMGCATSRGTQEGFVLYTSGDEALWVADVLAAVRIKGADPEYLELLKARAEIERLKEQVAGYQAKLAVLEGLR